MKFNNDQPIYSQIMDYIKFKIVRGDYQLGQQVQSVRDVALELKVNPNTVQRAYQELRNEDILFAKRGLGNFVTEDEEKIGELKVAMAMSTLKSFISEMKNMGLSKEESIKLIEKIWEEKNDSHQQA